MVRLNDIPHRPVEVFDGCMPAAFLRDCIRRASDCMRRAREICGRGFEWPEEHYLTPHVRRALFEESLRAIAGRYSDMEAHVRRNAASNNWHTRVVCGRVALTASFVQSPDTKVREAEFRKTYARSSQWLLFETPKPPGENDFLYCIFIYGPGDADPTQLGFAHVVFPAPDGKDYLGRIDLLARFPEVLAAAQGYAEEAIEDALEPRFRKDIGGPERA